MSGRNRNKKRKKKARLAVTAEVRHEETSGINSSQHPESELVCCSDRMTADLNDVVSIAIPPSDDSSSLSFAGRDISGDISRSAHSALNNGYERAVIIQGGSVKNEQHLLHVDEILLNSIDSSDLRQAIRLLTSQNSFTPDGLNQALISACRRGHKLLVQTLVRVGANIEHPDENGNTPLLICAEQGFTDIVRFLVSRHANVKARNSTGNTALILSVRPAGSTDLTRFLLEQQDVDIYHKNQDGQTALLRAIHVMDVDTIHILLKKIVKSQRFYRHMGSAETIGLILDSSHALQNVCTILETHLRTGKSPLELAIREFDVTSLEILLDCQFSSDLEKRKYINNALMFIFGPSWSTRIKPFCLQEIIMVQKLLEYEADIHQGSEVRPLRVAVEVGDLELVELLCRYGALKNERSYAEKQDVLLTAARNGRRDVMELLLKYGYQADTNSYFSLESPLKCALNNNHTECAKFLIQNGAKIDVVCALVQAMDHPSSTYINFLLENYMPEVLEYCFEPSHIAGDFLISLLQKGSSDNLGILLDAAVHVSERNPCRGSSVMTSTNNGVAESLNEEGCGFTNGLDPPLILAISSRQCRDASTVMLARALIEHGASVNCRSVDSKTPLMLAASKADCVDMLEMLLDHGADVYQRDNDGNTALFHAMTGGYCENPTFLIQTSADKERLINAQNNEAVTPLMFAAIHGYTLMATVLLNEGADVHITDSRGNTALHHLLTGSYWFSEELLESLIKAEIDVNYQNHDGLSPLMLAAKTSMVYVTRTLLNAGADVNAVNRLDQANTAVSYLPNSLYINSNTVACLEALLDKGANASCLNPAFLHRSIVQKETIIAKLIDCGLGPADVHPDKLPMTGLKTGALTAVSPLCVALLVGNTRLAQYFVDIQFLTNSDVSMFASSAILQAVLTKEGLVDSVRFLREACSQPMSLVSLSLVAASSVLGFFPGRESLVNSLHLPEKIRDRLLFKSEQGQVAQSKLPTESDSSSDDVWQDRLLPADKQQYHDTDDDDSDFYICLDSNESDFYE